MTLVLEGLWARRNGDPAKMGLAARRRWETSFTVKVIAERLHESMRSIPSSKEEEAL